MEHKTRVEERNQENRFGRIFLVGRTVDSRESRENMMDKLYENEFGWSIIANPHKSHSTKFICLSGQAKSEMDGRIFIHYTQVVCLCVCVWLCSIEWRRCECRES